jgi:hypothetical protein
MYFMEVPLNNSEAAKALGIAPVTLSHLRAAGGGPAYTKIGRSIRYRRCDLEAFQLASLVRPGTDRAEVPE